MFYLDGGITQVIKCLKKHFCLEYSSLHTPNFDKITEGSGTRKFKVKSCELSALLTSSRILLYCNWSKTRPVIVHSVSPCPISEQNSTRFKHSLFIQVFCLIKLISRFKAVVGSAVYRVSPLRVSFIYFYITPGMPEPRWCSR